MRMTTGTVVEALQRNFGGMPQHEFQDVVKRFVKHLAEACGPDLFPEPEPEDFRPTLEVLADALAERGHAFVDQHATLSDRSARPKLVIDYTGEHHPMQQLERHQLNLRTPAHFILVLLCSCTCMTHSNMHTACCNVVHRHACVTVSAVYDQQYLDDFILCWSSAQDYSHCLCCMHLLWRDAHCVRFASR